MTGHQQVHRVGEATIIKIDELTLEGVAPLSLYPGENPDKVMAAAQACGPQSVDRARGTLHQSIHAWLLRTPNRTILIDTGTGNDKERPAVPLMHHLREPFLERLAAVGAMPDDIDTVLLTHIHADHVGWNTRLVGGRWVPTFPNAVHIVSALERAYCAALARGDGSDELIRHDVGLGRMDRLPMPGVYEDSMRPVIEAGLAREIEVDGSEQNGFRHYSSPGHSIDHASIEFTSRGERALFWGDVLHHPVQVVRPDLNSAYCEFPDAARHARRWALDHAAETGALVFTTHFAGSSVGRVSRQGQGFAWRFA